MDYDKNAACGAEFWFQSSKRIKMPNIWKEHTGWDEQQCMKNLRWLLTEYAKHQTENPSFLVLNDKRNYKNTDPQENICALRVLLCLLLSVACRW